MIISDGYTIEYHQKANRLEIILPQTVRTISNTVGMVTNRRIAITPEEEAAILAVVKAIFERDEYDGLNRQTGGD